MATKISLEQPLHHAQMAGAVGESFGASGQIKICDRHSRAPIPHTSIHFSASSSVRRPVGLPARKAHVVLIAL